MKRFLLSLIALVFLSCSAEAACGDGASACFWIGGGANANWNTTDNWSNTSGGASSGTTPATGDSICFDNANNNNSTINATRSVLSINTAGTCTGGSGSAYTGTITQNASTNLTVTGNDASANGGTTFLLSSSSGWTAASATTSDVIFTATSGTSTFTPNSSGASRNFGDVQFNGSGGTFKLGSTITGGATSTLTLTAGTFDNNGVDITYGAFSSANSNTRGLSNATGSWNLNANLSATILDVGTTTNFTSVSTAFSGLTINVSGATVGLRSIAAGVALTIGTVNVGANTSGGIFGFSAGSSSTLTITNFTVTAPNWIRVQGASLRAYTFTNSVTLTGTSSNPIALTSDGGGSAFPVITGSFSGTYVAIGSFSFGTGTQSFTNCYNVAAVTSSGTLTCTAPVIGGGRIIGG